MAPLVRTGGSRHTGLAALPHRNIHKIAEDISLGEGFCIGHSYFCDMNSEELTDQRLIEIVEFELIPLLKEYWFDEPKNVERWSEKLRGAIS